MAKTLEQIQEQIAKLQEVEAKLRKVEADGVIARIKVAIEAYGFKPDDLFGTPQSAGTTTTTTASKSSGGAPGSSKVKPKFKSKSKLSAKAKFGDGSGNEWVGRGPHPLWLREALASGKSLADFALSGATEKAAKQSIAPSASVAGQEAAGADSSAPDSAATLPATKVSKAGKTAKRSKVASIKKPSIVKFRDGENVWSGRGPRPKWLVAAINGGKTQQEFAV